jgi:haloacetate dehalogenase
MRLKMTTHLQSRQTEEGFSRRGLVQALAVGAAPASVATPSSAQQSAVLAEATPADYVRDPTRWGSAEVAALFPNFRHLDIRTKGAVIRVRHGGSGPPLLLLHGNSQNHATWFGVAARLAERYYVVLADLRGYGDPITSITAPAYWPRTCSKSWRVLGISGSSSRATTAAHASAIACASITLIGS